MPIIENVNGVMKTHTVEFENVGGVIREKSSVVVNDGGVLREVYSASVEAATVEGVTLKVVAEDHIVIVESGTFTFSAPKGARIIVGGAAKEQNGGNVTVYTLEKTIRNAQCTLQCGAVNSGNSTILTINGVTYDSGSAKRIIQSKWGPIGGDGGKGYTNYYQSSGNHGVSDPTGAGGGGGGYRYYQSVKPDWTGSATPETSWIKGSDGGNFGGYGNYGGYGGFATENKNQRDGLAGASGVNGVGCSANASTVAYNMSYEAGGGGGGGYAAGGGICASGSNSANTYFNRGTLGQGGSGIIVIEW